MCDPYKAVGCQQVLLAVNMGAGREDGLTEKTRER